MQRMLLECFELITHYIQLLYDDGGSYMFFSFCSDLFSDFVQNYVKVVTVLLIPLVLIVSWEILVFWVRLLKDWLKYWRNRY